MSKTDYRSEWKKFEDEVKDMAKEIVEDNTTEDYVDWDRCFEVVHEYADGSELVIYPHRAKAFIMGAPIDDLDYAFDQWKDTGGLTADDIDNVDKIFTALAYWLFYNTLYQAVSELQSAAE